MVRCGPPSTVTLHFFMQKKPVTKKNGFSGVEVYVAEMKEKFEKKNPSLKAKMVEKTLTEKYKALPAAKKVRDNVLLKLILWQVWPVVMCDV